MESGGLDAAFLELVQDHAQKASDLHLRIARDRKQALTSATRVSTLLEEKLNAGVRDVFITEKQIESETRAVAVTVQRFSKQTSQWLNLFQGLDAALKEIGDFENWIKVIESDCESIADALGRIKP